MVVRCLICKVWFDDEFRSTICLHDTFPANDGQNNFEFHEDSYLSETEPPTDRDWELSPESCLSNPEETT